MTTELARMILSFAGHHALVYWGYGNECQMSLVISLRRGKVYGLAEQPTKQPLESSRGFDFKLTSRLVIVDPPCRENYNPCVSLQAVRKPLGKRVTRKIKTKTYMTSLPGAPDGEFVVIQFGSSFEKKKSLDIP